MSKVLLALLPIFINISFAAIQFKVTAPSYKYIKFKEGCAIMGMKDTPLVEAKGQSHIDCMGTYFNAGNICAKKFAEDPNLMRGYVFKETNEIACQSGELAHLSVDCKNTKKFCKTPKKSCKELQQYYARRLDLNHYSKVQNNLNCYYSKNSQIDFNFK